MVSLSGTALILSSCGPNTHRTEPHSQPSASVSASPRPTPLPSAELPSDALIEAIMTSQKLELRVSEELMLIGDVRLASGQQVSFDDVNDKLQITNQNPDLLNLEVQSRLIRALKPGIATLLISARETDLQIRVTVQISDLTDSIDPNIALVDVEID